TMPSTTITRSNTMMSVTLQVDDWPLIAGGSFGLSRANPRGSRMRRVRSPETITDGNARAVPVEPLRGDGIVTRVTAPRVGTAPGFLVTGALAGAGGAWPGAGAGTSLTGTWATGWAAAGAADGT